MWNKKKLYKWTYLQNRNRIIDVESNIIGTGGKEERDKFRDLDYHIHPTIYIKSITNKDLLYSTEKSQYSVMACMGR